MRQITRREAEEIGVAESPEIPMRKVFNARTGEIKTIPSGIDVGWESNPGQYRKRRMEEFLQGKLDSADPAIAHAAARDMASSWRMQRILDGSASGSVPVAMLPREIAERLTNPIGIIIASLSALALVVYKNWDKIVAFMSKKVEAVRAAFDAGILQGVFKALAAFNPFILAHEGIKGLIAYVMGLLDVPDKIIAAFTAFSLFDTGVALIQSLWDGMSSLLTDMVDAITAKLSALKPQWISDLQTWIGGDDAPATSPDHYRLYFAMTGPSHALTQNNYSTMWQAAEANVVQAGTMLLNFHKEQAIGSLTKADLLLERIKGGAYEVFTPDQCENFLVAFSQVMDDAYRLRPFDLHWISSLWDRAQRLIPLLLSEIESTTRNSVITAMFREGAAVGWLTSLFRNEIFAHGRHGDNLRPDHEWLFSDEELDLIANLMIHRFRTMTIKEISSYPDPANILFAWQQGGDKDGPLHLVQKHIATDVGFVEVLELLFSPVHSSDRGTFNVLRKDSIAPFLEYETVRPRLETLRHHSELGKRVTHLEKFLPTELAARTYQPNR